MPNSLLEIFEECISSRMHQRTRKPKYKYLSVLCGFISNNKIVSKPPPESHLDSTDFIHQLITLIVRKYSTDFIHQLITLTVRKYKFNYRWTDTVFRALKSPFEFDCFQVHVKCHNTREYQNRRAESNSTEGSVWQTAFAANEDHRWMYCPLTVIFQQVTHVRQWWKKKFSLKCISKK